MTDSSGYTSPEPPVASPSLSEPRTVLPAAGASSKAPVAHGAHAATALEPRPWSQIARKVVAAALGGVTLSGVLWLAGLAGLDLPEGWAALIATGAATLAGAFTTESAPRP